MAETRASIVDGVTLDTSVYVGGLNSGGIGSRILGMARAGVIRIDTSIQFSPKQ